MCERQCYIFVKSRPGDKDQTKLHYMFYKLRRGIELINIKRIYLYDTDQNRTEIHTRKAKFMLSKRNNYCTLEYFYYMKCVILEIDLNSRS